MYRRGARLTGLASLASASAFLSTTRQSEPTSLPSATTSTNLDIKLKTEQKTATCTEKPLLPTLDSTSTLDLSSTRRFIQNDPLNLENRPITAEESDVRVERVENAQTDNIHCPSPLAAEQPFVAEVLSPVGPESLDFSTAEGCLKSHLPQDVDSSTRVNQAYQSYDIEAVRPNEQGTRQAQQEKLKAAIAKAKDLCWSKMYESGTPGLVLAIAVNGKVVWQHGFGYADLENRLQVGTGCIMRIASISKSITMAALAKLYEEGKVDLDASVSKYVASWPIKEVDGEKVDITVRQLCSHLGGIRHYLKKGEKTEGSEFKQMEYHIKDHYKTTEESLNLFKEDELMSQPGSEFLYSTHGFTLLAAVIENVTGQPFDKYMKQQFVELGLSNTYLDEVGPIIYNRAKYYIRDGNHRLKNAPYVDNSYKWAGGGFLSNVQDLTKFGNAMLFSFQKKSDKPTNKSKADLSSVEPDSKQGKPDVVPEKPEVKADPEMAVPTDGQCHVTTDKSSASHDAPLPSELDQGLRHQVRSESGASHRESSQKQPESDQDLHGVEHSVDDAQSVLDVNNVESNESPVDVVFQPGPYSNVNKSDNPRIKLLPGYLKSETMEELWKPVPNTKLGWGGEDTMMYGLGWGVRPRVKNYGFCRNQNFYVSHTGGAIGASSVLLIAPSLVTAAEKGISSPLPRGVVVSVMCNLEGVGLNKLAVDIAKAFEGISTEQPVRVQKVYQC